MKNEKSCGAFIIDDNKVLIIKQKKTGNFGFPKGHMEKGEVEEQTAIREVKEETGIDIKLVSNKRYSISYVQNETINKEVVYYIANVINKDFQNKKEKEISDIIWIEIDEVENILSFENIKKLWLYAKKDLQNKNNNEKYIL